MQDDIAEDMECWLCSWEFAVGLNDGALLKALVQAGPEGARGPFNWDVVRWRYGEGDAALEVGLADTVDQARTAAEAALRRHQARLNEPTGQGGGGGGLPRQPPAEHLRAKH